MEKNRVYLGVDALFRRGTMEYKYPRFIEEVEMNKQFLSPFLGADFNLAKKFNFNIESSVIFGKNGSKSIFINPFNRLMLCYKLKT